MLRQILAILLILGSMLCCSGREWEIPAVTPQVPAVPQPATQVWVSSAEELAALGVLTPGVEVIWRDGSYADQLVVLKAAGTEEQPVVMRAETPGRVHFTGLSRLEIDGQWVEVKGFWWQDPTPVRGKAVVTFRKGSSHAHLMRCAITGNNCVADPKTDTKWVSLNGRNHCVEQCSFLAKRNIGALMVVWMGEELTPAHRILKNHFERPLTLFSEEGKPLNGQEVIRIGDSNSSMRDAACLVEGNYFYKCHGEQAEIVSNKSCANIYRGNLFEQSRGSLTLRHGNRCQVVGNFFLGGGVDNTGGVRIIGEDHLVEQNYMQGLLGRGYKAAISLVRGQQDPLLSGYWQVKRACVRNNVVVDCRCGLEVNYGSSGQVMPVVESKIEYNIISLSNPKDYAVNCTTDPEPQIEWQGNMLYGGRVVGVELESLAAAPRIPKMEAVIEQVRRQAGVDW